MFLTYILPASGKSANKTCRLTQNIIVNRICLHYNKIRVSQILSAWCGSADTIPLPIAAPTVMGGTPYTLEFSTIFYHIFWGITRTGKT